jgi:outer membrane lipoprotein-sorting protein
MIFGIDRMRGALGLALWLVTSVAAHCAEPPSAAAWSLEYLMQKLAQVKSSKATFIERKHLRILNAPLESSGTLVYIAPGSLEKHTLKPKPETLVLEGDTLRFEDTARNRRRTLRLQEYPVIWAFVESIRATLAGDLKSLQRHFRVTLEGSENEWRLTLYPSDTDVARVVTRIRVAGARTSIRSIEITEVEGDRSVMLITELK